MTGFLGQSSNDEITTLGRGGSDLSATVIGVACGADEVQVTKQLGSGFGKSRNDVMRLDHIVMALYDWTA